MHCTRVVGCQEVVIATPEQEAATVSCAARFERMCKTPATLPLTTGAVNLFQCDAYYTAPAPSALRVLSSSAGFRRNHDDNNNSSSISCVGTEAVWRSGGV